MQFVLCYCSVSHESQQDRKTSLDNADIHSTRRKVKSSKASRLSAPLPETNAKESTKTVVGEIKAADVQEGVGRKGGRACDKASCVRAGFRPKCFVAASQRFIFYVFLSFL